MTEFSSLLSACFPGNPPPKPNSFLIAVSGGPDSLALLRLAALSQNPNWCFAAATVDHGLRPEAACEARYVAKLCRAWAIPHQTLSWTGWDGTGNLQAEARAARYRLLTSHAEEIGASAVIVAHHRQDQRETHCLAKARGHQGARLAGMRAARDLAPGVKLLRPFLSIDPARLAALLRKEGIEAVADPSNQDRRFARVALREDLARYDVEQLAEIDQAIVRACEQRREEMGRLAAVIAWLDAAGALVFEVSGRVRLDCDAFETGEREVRRALLSRLLTAAGGAPEAPDRDKVTRLERALDGCEVAFVRTLGGARVSFTPGPGTRKGTLVFEREFGRKGPPSVRVSNGLRRYLFDERFDIVLSDEEAEEAGWILPLGALGRGNLHDKTLPCLVDRSGALIAAHPLLADKLERPSFSNAFSRLAWRFGADLHADAQR
ncbi:tRNA lysidine(34) synthetase TilS [Fulvimarina manganoxydans]|uniref:tRNA lysidine(34) synthetase TilS n=1 Tax=Fulvimarina manganoxydans TaxID=937218 RepID=UPI0014832D88|nr:tRNA lysidine(34) synthetase TilS [Fulvimarina manganoxydans]